ncbi:alpha/beta-hydrolase [Collybia nuda]|uniref:Alpha/beta-hydrolase n=1 Tax=Collybia nuda TaxID=64659 RepID=A0A9P6CLZ7_9AGAR|nr:alpha/beta-hydrolase [Collybia nuda]
MVPQTASYGTWASPITAESITKGSVIFADIVVDPVTSAVYHLENRPSEAGRSVLVNTKTGQDIVGKDWNVRTGVQEYGGAPAIAHNGKIYFSHYIDGRIYQTTEGTEPEAVTPENKAHRFANFDIHPIHSHLLVAILEDHTIDVPEKIVTSLAIVNTHTKAVQTILSGADFYAAPKFSPDGSRIAWQQWYHPDMPWEGAEIHVADIIADKGDILVKNDVLVAGERERISSAFPAWASNDTLIFTSDESGYINPWKFSNGKAAPLFSQPISEEFGASSWGLNIYPVAIIDEAGRYALFSASKDGRDVLYVVDTAGGTHPQGIDSPYVTIGNLRSISRARREVVFTGAKADEGSAIVKCVISVTDSLVAAEFSVLKSTTFIAFPKEIISKPQSMTIIAPGGDNPLHLIYYPPVNPEYAGSNITGELPPCILGVHGGPTFSAAQSLSWQTQYFTSRGWAWLDVNYGGSSGYGRAYTERLRGQWGVVDVEDCVHAAKVISSAPYNLVDPKRIVIRGQSAGGYTVLATLSGGPNPAAFAAGTASYGISDLKPLGDHTHKFESRYLEKLLGGTFEEIPKIYIERSPINNVEKIVSPLLLLQGEVDKVVLKEQSEMIYDSIKARGGVVEYKMYEGEGHGWRQEKNIKDALERELGFYERVLGLKK